ncbi:unnamed protein product [Notodromas monacha]|uniref:Histone deacetylase domain-containing protein n=1 Tax=Notodromas monacha TaxID=399045 RepID=A0A7R9G9E8_9CRUS|nr:unnamed protein product [Notodromas monacha]CAG0912799.1 unnamed protein product [Notodromas monacha]
MDRGSAGRSTLPSPDDERLLRKRVLEGEDVSRAGEKRRSEDLTPRERRPIANASALQTSHVSPSQLVMVEGGFNAMFSQIQIFKKILFDMLAGVQNFEARILAVEMHFGSIGAPGAQSDTSSIVAGSANTSFVQENSDESFAGNEALAAGGFDCMILNHENVAAQQPSYTSSLPSVGMQRCDASFSHGGLSAVNRPSTEMETSRLVSLSVQYLIMHVKNILNGRMSSDFVVIRKTEPSNVMEYSYSCVAFDLTKAFYDHMRHAVLGLAGGNICSGFLSDVLGPSWVRFLANGLACPNISNFNSRRASPGIKATIRRCWSVLSRHWKSLAWLGDVGLDPPGAEEILQVVKEERKEEHFVSFDTKSVALVYDEKMMLHKMPRSHPEKPERIKAIWAHLLERRLLERCIILKAREADDSELSLCHLPKYVEHMDALTEKLKAPIVTLEMNENSIYASKSTNQCAKLAAGSCIELVKAVLEGKALSGFAIVRPPGHHAERDFFFGFCFFNNVSLMAEYALRKHHLERILIIDWDVHHGNGTQNMFESDPRVLLVSLHRFGSDVFPAGPDGDFYKTGIGGGVGYNINIPWHTDEYPKPFGAPEYIAAFLHIILPIAYEFDPELVLISAGFDSLRNDPLDNRVQLDPESFAHMTHLLSSLAQGRVVMALEGGYHLPDLSKSVGQCVSTMLGDPLPLPDPGVNADWSVNRRASNVFFKLCRKLKEQWSNVDVHVRMNKGVSDFVPVTL